MTRRYLDDLDQVLAAAGLHVVTLDGWQSRGRGGTGYDSSGGPWCVMWHHTASNGDGASDAHYCTYGDDDAPLCNLVIGRDAVVYLCAAGATNTNGKGQALRFSRGTVPADSMNAYAVGIEISGDGVGMTYPQVQIDAAMAASLAVAAAYQLTPADVATHQLYAPDRKVDPATAAAVAGPWRPGSVTSSGTWSALDLAAELDARATGSWTPTPPPDEEDDEMLLRVIGDADRGGPAIAAAPGYWQAVNDEQFRALTAAGYCDGQIHMLAARQLDVLRSLFLYGSTTWQQPLADLVHGTTPTAGEMISGIHYEVIQR